MTELERDELIDISFAALYLCQEHLHMARAYDGERATLNEFS